MIHHLHLFLIFSWKSNTNRQKNSPKNTFERFIFSSSLSFLLPSSVTWPNYWCLNPPLVRAPGGIQGREEKLRTIIITAPNYYSRLNVTTATNYANAYIPILDEVIPTTPLMVIYVWLWWVHNASQKWTYACEEWCKESTSQVALTLVSTTVQQIVNNFIGGTYIVIDFRVGSIFVRFVVVVDLGQSKFVS